MISLECNLLCNILRNIDTPFQMTDLANCIVSGSKEAQDKVQLFAKALMVI